MRYNECNLNSSQDIVDAFAQNFASVFQHNISSSNFTCDNVYDHEISDTFQHFICSKWIPKITIYSLYDFVQFASKALDQRLQVDVIFVYTDLTKAFN